MGIKRIVSGRFETNTYLVTKGSDAIIIDPSDGIKKHLDEINEYNILAVLITHGHIDHIDGVGYFKSPVYVSGQDQKAFTDLSVSLYRLCFCKPSYNVDTLSFVNVEENKTYTVGPFEFSVIETPGHTKGSVCFLFGDTLFSGDTLFFTSCGRTDFPTGNRFEMRNSLQKLMKLPSNVNVYPGHDEKTTIGYEQKNNPYL